MEGQTIKSINYATVACVHSSQPLEIRNENLNNSSSKFEIDVQKCVVCVCVCPIRSLKSQIAFL